MLRNIIRRSGMLALVLALALAGAAPAAALDFGGRNLDGWHAIWNWFMGVMGWEEREASGNSGGMMSVYENECVGIDPNGCPVATTVLSCSAGEENCGIDPNGMR
ncbi:MAG TPA: hypothetical protein VFR31_03795 [Thermoanaerobaculia bacterium]|nr:hypothetical protein [Thermoanaerobaculia bacterium]